LGPCAQTATLALQVLDPKPPAHRPRTPTTQATAPAPQPPARGCAMRATTSMERSAQPVPPTPGVSQERTTSAPATPSALLSQAPRTSVSARLGTLVMVRNWAPVRVRYALPGTTALEGMGICRLRVQQTTPRPLARAPSVPACACQATNWCSPDARCASPGSTASTVWRISALRMRWLHRQRPVLRNVGVSLDSTASMVERAPSVLRITCALAAMSGFPAL
jgi:hypothetical protein